MLAVICVYVQLGFESRNSRGGPESVKQSVFQPTVIDNLTPPSHPSRPPRDDVCSSYNTVQNKMFFYCLQSPSSDAPLLDIDLEWDLPDFATVGM